MTWQNNWRVQTITGELNSRAGQGFIDKLNQFFAFNPCITCLQLNTSWEQSSASGEAGISVDVHYTQPYGVRYFAEEFRDIGNLSAADQATEFFSSQPYWTPVFMKDISPSRVRNIGTRLLIVYTNTTDIMEQDLFMVRGAIATDTIPAGAVGTAVDHIDPSRPAFALRNLNNVDWNEGTPHLAMKQPGYGNVWAGLANPNYPAVVTESVDLPVPACANPDLCSPADAPNATTTFTPPEFETSCHRTRYECQCIDDVTSWVLTVNQCVPNALCDGNVTTDGEFYDVNVPNGCPAGGPPPAPLPPGGIPNCCDDKCHSVEWKCIEGYDGAEWQLVSDVCVPNSNCQAASEGNDAYIECTGTKLVYQKRDACDPNKPPTPPTNKADGTPCEPTCGEDYCHKFKLICKAEAVSAETESFWSEDTNECVPNDECEASAVSSPVTNCTETEYTYELRNSCPNFPAPPAVIIPTDAQCEPKCAPGWKINGITFSEGTTACILTANGLFDRDCIRIEDLDTAVRTAMGGIYEVSESPFPGSDPCNQTFTCCPTTNYRTILNQEFLSLGIIGMDFEDDIVNPDFNDGQILVIAERC
ncbi:MAG: hypothetical protein F6K48_03025 [Okeania sp. SIO3H1]|nr:hypothetical protein [Okeania sp. SIO3H1]